MIDGMATKKYTVTLPEELAEAIRAEVGPGGFSRYVTQAIERQRERERLGEAVSGWEKEYGEITEAEMDEVEAEHREIERLHAELARAREAAADSAPEPHRDAA
jgi:Arc/MetJ-type ribon-helix-helix transcriptional regulator